ncbi:S8 family serine peptidase [Maribacter sp. 2307ULW6-5]|uniref:S8 family serine peptidase n=1 Tax=Maribacter sp. 2307ULW6-5 TaxID=3386275 RepID=UPI0039BC8ECA
MAKRKGLPLKEKGANGQTISLQGLGEDGTPIYYETASDEASTVVRSHMINIYGDPELPIDGSGMQVAVWDAGAALMEHREFGSRAYLADDPLEVSKHATMVTGSIVSEGIKRKARGVAPNAEVLSYDWSRDKIEATAAAAKGLLVSNHSYGIKTDRVPDWYFGAYTKVAQDWDAIMYRAPHYLMVSAAGNAQRRRDNQAPSIGSPEQGYDVMLGFTLAKNGLTVAAAHADIDHRGVLKKAQVSPFSSFGPVDDGRIKPDLAGDGSRLLSTCSTGTSSYDTSSGTSMAAPGVTGSVLLLQQYHAQLYGNHMRAATVKGLLLHTADDVDAPGPDYRMGWGVLNAKQAAQLLWEKDYSSMVVEDTLKDQQPKTHSITANGNEPLKISLSWTDPEGRQTNTGTLNDPTPALVHDLDIRLSQDGTTHLPWVLMAKRPEKAAAKGDNLVDPYERIEVELPKGTYTLTISHKGTLPPQGQHYSLLVSGLKRGDCAPVAPRNIKLTTPTDDGATLDFEGQQDGFYEVRYKPENTQDWILQTSTQAPLTLSELAPNTDYVLQMRTFCSQNIASEFTAAHRFHFKGKETLEGVLMPVPEPLGQKNLTISLYPNPAVDQVNIASPVGDTAQYQIMSSAGVALKFGKAKNAKVNVADLASGLYVLQVYEEGVSRSAKFYKY